MLRAVGIISEYNPFHNGHRYQLQQAKKRSGAQISVAIMGGNWLQRGEPAIYDKWQRAAAALESGVDIVVELPFFAAVQPSHIFATGAVRLAAAMKCTWLAFGAETPNLDYQLLIDHQPQRDKTFKQFDRPYASIFQDYLYQQTGIRLHEPNDILAFGYANANEQLGSPLQLLPIQRVGAAHNDHQLTTGEIASASAIRTVILSDHLRDVQDKVTLPSWQMMVGSKPLSWDQYWPLLRYELTVTPIEQLQTIYQMTEGIEYRLKKAAITAKTFSEFLHLVKTKRYTYTRIQRLCSYVLMHATSDEMLREPDYIRLLGFSAAGQRYLNQIKGDLTLPVITKVNQDTVDELIGLDFRVGLLIEMMTEKKQDFYQHPIILKK